MCKLPAKVAILLLVVFFLTSCTAPSNSQDATFSPTSPTELQTEPSTPEESTEPATSETPTEPSVSEESTEPATSETPTEPSVSEEPTAPIHSPLYIPGLKVEDVILYFNEVCLDAEFVNSGNASLLQKWTAPICYTVNGNPTPKDLEVLQSFTSWLNTVEGFPGISEVKKSEHINLQIYFCSQAELLNRMGANFTNTDGAVTFWYSNNEIFNAIICIRNDIAQQTRNSVILEELYNGLGPIQDTNLRTDSIIFSGFSTPQALHEIDELILKLLYHPSLKCGWNTKSCEAQIRALYY